MFLYYRSKDVLEDPELKGKKRPWAEQEFFSMWSRAARHPRL
jgi:hypothetical protein